MFPPQLPSMAWSVWPRCEPCLCYRWVGINFGYRVAALRKKSAEANTAGVRGEEGNFRATMLSLLTNPPYVLNQLAATSDIWLITGMGAFLPKVRTGRSPFISVSLTRPGQHQIIETQFRLSAEVASLVAGGSLIGGVVAGMFLGSFISRHWDTRKVQISKRLLLLHLHPLTLRAPCRPPSGVLCGRRWRRCSARRC